MSLFIASTRRALDTMEVISASGSVTGSKRKGKRNKERLNRSQQLFKNRLYLLLLLSRRFQNEIESAKVQTVRLLYFEKQIRTKQRIGRVTGFTRKIELCAKVGAIGRLQSHMVMTGPTRIQTRYDGFEAVVAAGI
jgi:hypothetical protein